MHVRTMERGDLGAVAALSQELGYPVTPEQLVERLAVMGASRADALYVAQSGDAVVGFVQVQERWSIESGRSAELVALVVGAAARRTGAGRALVDACAWWAKRQGIGGLRVRSNLVRVESHRFYPALGFKAVKQQQVYELDFD